MGEDGLTQFSQTLTEALAKFGAGGTLSTTESSSPSTRTREFDTGTASEDASFASVMSSLYGGSFAATGRTTAMLKNVPAKYTQRKLMRELLGAGFQGKLDFIYLPMDPRSRNARGFAFCNFSTPAAADEFCGTFHKKFLKSYTAEGPLEVAPAEIQGFEANVDHYFEVRASRKEKGRDTFGSPTFLRPLPTHMLAQYRNMEKESGSQRSSAPSEASSRPWRVTTHDPEPGTRPKPLGSTAGAVSLHRCTTCWQMKSVHDFCPHCEQVAAYPTEKVVAYPTEQVASTPPRLVGPSFWI